MTFQASDFKEKQFFDLLKLREGFGSKSLNIQILYMCMLYEQLLIILKLVSIDLNSFLGRNLNICMVYILLNQDIIFFTNTIDLMNTRIYVLDN